jgi:hypothetical protein
MRRLIGDLGEASLRGTKVGYARFIDYALELHLSLATFFQRPHHTGHCRCCSRTTRAQRRRDGGLLKETRHCAAGQS